MKIPKNGSKWLLIASSLILLATTLFWSVLSARLQNYNADQLVDGYLFESWSVFTNASFPGAHSFLLKWPLFGLAAALGNTAHAVTALTVVCALAIIATLAIILARIERRPAMLSLWFLALSSMLLLVPAQPAPGALLPVNFAMFTTRNIEYAVLLAVFILFTRTKRWRTRSALIAVVLGVLLMATDGLFMPLMVGAVGFVFLLQPRKIKRTALWTAIVATGFIGAYAATKSLQIFNITDFSSQGSVSPYNIGGSVTQFATAAAYAVLGVASLFGANPAYAHLSLSGWPSAFINSLQSPAIIAYVGNAFMLVILTGLTAYFVYAFKRLQSRATLLAGLTLGSALAATAIYILTNHYYPVDSRYLAVWFFALILCASVVLRTLELSKKFTMIVVLGLLAVLPFAVLGSWQQYERSRDALVPRAQFQTAVASQLVKYHVGTLIGDYWDVVPIRQAANNEANIVPLSSCTMTQQALSSTAWQHKSGSVAYLVNSQPYQSGFKACDPAAVKHRFGTPTREIAVNVPGQKQSWLYLYEGGIKHAKGTQKHARKQPSAIPTPHQCTAAKVLQVVAHEDDDILFMNPDLQHAVDADACIMSVYVTAGDGGMDEAYSTSRMAGAEAAYTYIYNGSSNWTTKQVVLRGRTVTVATMQGQPKLLLLFLNLPDGNITGRGFSSRDNESLGRLRIGDMQKIKPINGSSGYGADDLTNALLAIMNAYQPSEVRTQNYNTNVNDGDHSDHHAVGYFTAKAFANYNANAVLKSYAGYPERSLPANVEGSILAAKEGAFFAYAGFDGAACKTVVACYGSSAYGDYLPRQYSKVVAENSYKKPAETAPMHATREPKQMLTRRTCVLGERPYVISCPFNLRTNLAY